MTDQDTIYTLVVSSNAGRYALDRPDGQDVTSGDVIAIKLGGTWVNGSVEHTGALYSIEDLSSRMISGYYFQATNGGVCGLCVGMHVRLLST